MTGTRLVDRAAHAWVEHTEADEREKEARLARDRDLLVTEAELMAMSALGASNSDVEIGQFTGTDTTGYYTQMSVELTIDGLPFLYVKQRGYGRSGTDLYLVQTCPKCGEKDLASVRFLWQMGEALATGPHPEGCERLPVEKTTRAVSKAEITFLDGLVAFLHERGVMRDDEDAPVA
jgi:hypothetical protein